MIPTIEELKRMAMDKYGHGLGGDGWRGGYLQALEDHYLPAMREIEAMRDALDKIKNRTFDSSFLMGKQIYDLAAAALGSSTDQTK